MLDTVPSAAHTAEPGPGRAYWWLNITVAGPAYIAGGWGVSALAARGAGGVAAAVAALIGLFALHAALVGRLRGVAAMAPGRRRIWRAGAVALALLSGSLIAGVLFVLFVALFVIVCTGGCD